MYIFKNYMKSFYFDLKKRKKGNISNDNKRPIGHTAQLSMIKLAQFSYIINFLNNVE